MKKFHDLPDEHLAMLGCIVREPLVEIGVHARGRRGSDVEGLNER